jgi:hypothetical protein
MDGQHPQPVDWYKCQVRPGTHKGHVLIASLEDTDTIEWKLSNKGPLLRRLAMATATVSTNGARAGAVSSQLHLGGAYRQQTAACGVELLVDLGRVLQLQHCVELE